jgi:6,7-dimethyl-8-ribityllumazine synthase
MKLVKEEINFEIQKIPNAKIVILQTKWYREFTDKMVKYCLKTLQDAECLEPQIEIIPGALELPIAAQNIARIKGNLEAIICFGGIVKGDTYHFDMILKSCAEGLLHVSLKEDVPIINEVIAVDNLEFLKDRSQDNKSNKGFEAAIATTEIISWRRKIGYQSRPV